MRQYLPLSLGGEKNQPQAADWAFCGAGAPCSRRRTCPARMFMFCVAVLFPTCTSVLLSQTLKYSKPPEAKNGEILYKSGCIACHGRNGDGAPQTSTGFNPPDTFPDFTRCNQTTAETNMAYKDVIVHGGRSRGFSQIMPAFGELLTSEQIDDLIAYIRGFCTDKRWPRGELNLPRALVTEKAYPEDEVVISTAMNVTGAPGFTTDVIHEQRFGINNQIEIDVPINSQDQNHAWNSGLGDMTFAVKRVMFANLHTGSILSLQGGVLAPVGDHKHGFGNGTTTFEPFAAFDQLFLDEYLPAISVGGRFASSHRHYSAEPILAGRSWADIRGKPSAGTDVVADGGVSSRSQFSGWSENELGRAAGDADHH